MAEVSAHGITVDGPTGWDVAIYRREPDPAMLTPQSVDPATPELDHRVEHRPVVHLSTVPLPAVRGDFGGGVVNTLGPSDVFIVIFDHGPEAAGSALFGGSGVPWPLALEDFDASQLRTMFDGQVGCQRFFTVGDRAFMLYVVLGSDRMRRVLVPVVNRALAQVRLG